MQRALNWAFMEKEEEDELVVVMVMVWAVREKGADENEDEGVATNGRKAARAPHYWISNDGD